MESRGSHQLLNSWKEIATFLGRGVRTVQRWEGTLDLPVHRMGSGARSPVIAFTDELDTWLSTRIGDVPEASVSSPAIADVHPAVMKHLAVVRELRMSLNELRENVRVVRAQRLSLEGVRMTLQQAAAAPPPPSSSRHSPAVQASI